MIKKIFHPGRSWKGHLTRLIFFSLLCAGPVCACCCEEILGSFVHAVPTARSFAGRASFFSFLCCSFAAVYFVFFWLLGGVCEEALLADAASLPFFFRRLGSKCELPSRLCPCITTASPSESGSKSLLCGWSCLWAAVLGEAACLQGGSWFAWHTVTSPKRRWKSCSLPPPPSQSHLSSIYMEEVGLGYPQGHSTRSHSVNSPITVT